ncbi:hypothetical protein CR513_47946, partial [Mucuna pruriens]
MTRKRSSCSLHPFNPEIEKTLNRIRKSKNISHCTSRTQWKTITGFEGASDAGCVVPVMYPQLEPTQSYELKFGLRHMLPKFHGLAGEDPHKHLKEFHVVYSTMRPQGIPEDYIKMKVFPFSLDRAAKDWLYLQPVMFNTWGDIKRMFLKKFFSVSRIAAIRKEICEIHQHSRETLHEYWERFNKLYTTCPHHQINEQLLL